MKAIVPLDVTTVATMTATSVRPFVVALNSTDPPAFTTIAGGRAIPAPSVTTVTDCSALAPKPASAASATTKVTFFPAAGSPPIRTVA